MRILLTLCWTSLMQKYNNCKQKVLVTPNLTSCTFSGVFTNVCVLYIFSCYKRATSSSNCLTHIQIVFLSGTAMLHGIMNCHQKLFVSQSHICCAFKIYPNSKSLMSSNPNHNHYYNGVTNDWSQLDYIHLTNPTTAWIVTLQNCCTL